MQWRNSGHIKLVLSSTQILQDYSELSTGLLFENLAAFSFFDILPFSYLLAVFTASVFPNAVFPLAFSVAFFLISYFFFPLPFFLQPTFSVFTFTVSLWCVFYAFCHNIGGRTWARFKVSPSACPFVICMPSWLRCVCAVSASWVSCFM